MVRVWGELAHVIEHGRDAPSRFETKGEAANAAAKRAAPVAPVRRRGAGEVRVPRVVAPVACLDDAGRSRRLVVPEAAHGDLRGLPANPVARDGIRAARSNGTAVAAARAMPPRSAMNAA
ncbi:hypothetical protein [Burkholderia plantarii]|uniref:hypothetical protein n=1 Tax=Burkholderia plantarii TaxID=41899 RepID=UPI0005AEE27D|nr:hypothetical protein [Burkholderia plantarii]